MITSARGLKSRAAVWVPLTIVFALFVASATAEASSVLGFALVGGQGHQLPMLRLGRELSSRGHNFTMLLSTADEISRTLLQSQAFAGLNIISFDGPPYLGTRQWFEGLPRDPQKASTPAPRAQAPRKCHPPPSTTHNVSVKLDDMLTARNGVSACRICSHTEALWRLQTISRVLEESTDTFWSLIKDNKTLEALQQAGFDLFIQDGTNWPALFVQQQLGVPTVEFQPLPLLLPFTETLYQIPDPIAYIPQIGSALTPDMVSATKLTCNLAYVLPALNACHWSFRWQICIPLT